MIALTCNGNAAIRGVAIAKLFPDNPHFRFCESVTFGFAAAASDVTEVIAATPEAWCLGLRPRGVEALQLRPYRRKTPSEDRVTSGFVHGGSLWKIEASLGGGASEVWTSAWELVGAPGGSDGKPWRVRYSRTKEDGWKRASLDLARASDHLRQALQAAEDLASAQGADAAFIQRFHRARAALNPDHSDDNPADGVVGDFCPPGVLSEAAVRLLAASSEAWVFGGMGSWNDPMTFSKRMQPEIKERYDRISDVLFDALQEAVADAATSSAPLI